MVEKFKALIEDYKVTRNENEDFVWWYVQRVAPFNLRYVIAVALIGSIIFRVDGNFPQPYFSVYKKANIHYIKSA